MNVWLIYLCVFIGIYVPLFVAGPLMGVLYAGTLWLSYRFKAWFSAFGSVRSPRVCPRALQESAAVKAGLVWGRRRAPDQRRLVLPH